MNCLDISLETLPKILEEKDPQQRMEVADNPNTPPEILTILARDEYWSVRYGVARNPNTPPEILTILARDENDYVRWGVAQNPNSPP